MVVDTHLYLKNSTEFRVKKRNPAMGEMVKNKEGKLVRIITIIRKYYYLPFPLSNKMLMHYFHLKKKCLQSLN